MPNTLAHMAVQVPASRIASRAVPLSLVLLACVIPDLPWVLRHVLLFLIPDIDRLTLIQYASVQASLFFCLVLSAALAALAASPIAAWSVMAANCLLHLLIDAMELKPGNGVVLLAPFYWQQTSFGLVWPDSKVILVLSVAGLFVGVVLLFGKSPVPAPASRPSASRWVCAGVLLAAYYSAPFAFLHGPLDANLHSLHTLSDVDHRIGKPVQFDRRPYLKENDGNYVVAFTDERFRLVGDALPESGWASLSGVFVDERTIRVQQIRSIRADLRNLASIVGLSLVLLVWLRMVWRMRRRQ